MAELPLTNLIFLALGGYLCVLLFLGFLGKRKALDKSPRDFYLANSTFGFFVLLLTLFATQYSGNTLLGFPGEAYRMGCAYVMSVMFMMAIIASYLLYAPVLYPLSQTHQFVSPGDWIQHRFQSKTATVMAGCLMTFALLNYLLAQLMALGHVISGITGGKIPYAAGVVGFALVMVVYETLGGMRSVAWNDVFQGILLFLGMLVLVGILVFHYGGGVHIGEKIALLSPEKLGVPGPMTLRVWISSILLVGIGGCVYPQAIQRIYAARSLNVLKHSLSVMAFMPLLTTFLAFLVGIFALAELPGMNTLGSERILPTLLAQLHQTLPQIDALIMLILIAIVAGILSTSDSVLLSLSSIVTHDLFRPLSSRARALREEQLTRLGKWVSWGLTTILVLIAITPRLTLWRLLEIKFEVLMQTAPAFILGCHWKALKARSLVLGMLAGVIVSMGLTFSGHAKLWGFHSGVIGLVCNLAVCMTSALWSSGQRQ